MAAGGDEAARQAQGLRRQQRHVRRALREGHLPGQPRTCEARVHWAEKEYSSSGLSEGWGHGVSDNFVAKAV